MIVVGLRVITFSVLPLLLAAAHIRADRAARSRERKLETVLLYLFALGVASSGIGGFFGHFFLSDDGPFDWLGSWEPVPARGRIRQPGIGCVGHWGDGST